MSEQNEWDQIKAQPFRSHQCMHYNNEGRRCRAYAVRNEYTCVRHRIHDEVITIVKSDPFELFPAIAGLRNPAQIQAALAEVAVRLAAKTIDDKRAGLLLYALQSAAVNLTNSPAARLPRILDAAPLRRRRRRILPPWQCQQVEPSQDAVILGEPQSAESNDLHLDSDPPQLDCNAIKPAERDPQLWHHDSAALASNVSEVTEP